jgi:hypothetical protein
MSSAAGLEPVKVTFTPDLIEALSATLKPVPRVDGGCLDKD